MHNDYVMPRGKWPHIVSPQKLAHLDRRASEAINGDEGGTWNPATPIGIGGAGLSIGSGDASLVGVVRTRRGGRLVLPSDEYPGFETARSRDVLLPLRSARVLASSSDNSVDYASVPGSLVLRRTQILIAVPALILHHGATLSAFRLRFRIGAAPASVPGQWPAMRVIRCPSDGSFPTGSGNSAELYFIPSWSAGATLAIGDVIRPPTPNGYQYRTITAGTSGVTMPTWTTTVGATLSASGWGGTAVWRVEEGPNNTWAHLATMPWVSTVNAYYADGSVQELVLVPNANVVVDDDYSYFVDIQDESDTLNVFHSLIISQTNITTMRPT